MHLYGVCLLAGPRCSTVAFPGVLTPGLANRGLCPLHARRLGQRQPAWGWPSIVLQAVRPTWVAPYALQAGKLEEAAQHYTAALEADADLRTSFVAQCACNR